MIHIYTRKEFKIYLEELGSYGACGGGGGGA